MSGTSATDEAARDLLAWLDQRPRTAGPFLILTHDHPDPDALASAWALAYLTQKIGRTKAEIRYGGEIGRAENRIMAERLKIPAERLGPTDIAEAGAVALVDTQPAFTNNRFPPGRRADLIIDHHPRHADTEADLVIIDESVGATTTMLGEALMLAGLPTSKRLATAIIYGIGSETQNLGREAGARDVAVYLEFFSRADKKDLWRIENPQQPPSYFRTLSRGLANAFVVGEIIGVHLQELPHPDAVARLADILLTHEGMRWSIVTGRHDGNLHVSLRANSPGSNAGKLIKRIVGQDDRGGGHRMIAGGKLEIGRDADESVWTAAEADLVRALLKHRGVSPETPIHHPFRMK